MDQTVLKIEYLKELRLLMENEMFDEKGLRTIINKHLDVCNSIEKDLEISSQPL